MWLLLLACGAAEVDPTDPSDSAPVDPTDTAPPPCPTWSPPAALGTLPAGLDEVSGLAPSHTRDGYLWAHNDSGDAPELTVLAQSGRRMATWTLDTVAVDWEDMASAVIDGVPTLVVGDIGDNAAARPSVTLHVIPEPADPLTGGALVGTSLELTYEDGPRDAEALVIDPRSGEILIVTKSARDTGLYRVSGTRLKRVTDLDFTTPPLGGFAPTGADWSSDGWLLIRTYLPEAYLWYVSTGADVAEVIQRTPCTITLAEEPQAEAIAFSASGDALITASEGEGEPIYMSERD